MPISTRDLAGLPGVDELKRLLQSLATLDAIVSGGEDGYYDFQSHWGRNEQAGFMSNGSGDEFHAFFNRHGGFLNGFAHESPMSPHRTSPPKLWPGLLEGVPAEFDAAVHEPAFEVHSASTFVLWRLDDDNAWRRGPVEFPDGPDPDGSEDLLAMLDGSPATYAEWAADYYEVELDLDIVTHVYEHRPLTDDIVRTLNPEMSLGASRDALQRIGYPAG